MLSPLRGLTPAQALVVAVAGLLPVVHSMLLLRSYRTPQLALLIVALGGMVGASLNGSFDWIRRETRAVKLSVALFAASVMWMTIATLVGVDHDRSLMGHSFQSTGLLLWFAAFGLYVLALRHRFVIAGRVEGATLLAWIVLLAFLAMWLAARELVQEFLVPISNEGVPLPGLGQSAFLGSFAGVGLILAGGRWVRTPRIGGWLAMAAFLSAYLVVTQARIPIVIAALTLGAGLLIVRRRGASTMIIGSLALIAVAAGIAAHLFVIPTLRAPGTPLADRLGERVTRDRDLRGRFAPKDVVSGAQFRITVWGVAGRAVLREPLLGNGPANFTYSYRQLSTFADVEQIGHPETEMQDAHNIFMEVAATSGFPAALLLLAGMVALGSSMVAEPRRDELIWLRLGAVGFLGVLLVEPLSLVALPLMAIFGGAAAGGKEPPASPPRPWSAARPVPATLATVTAVLIAGSFVWSDRLLARGSIDWDRRALAEAVKFDPTCQQCLYQLAKVRSWDFKREGVGTEAWALAPFKRAIERQPEDSEAHFRLGGGLIFLRRHSLAVAPLLEARRLNPHSPQAALALGGAYLGAGQPAEALDSARDAVRIQPSALAYGIIADAAGQLGLTAVRDQALAEARRLEQNRR